MLLHPPRKRRSCQSGRILEDHPKPAIEATIAKKARKPKKVAQPIQYWTDRETDALFRVVRSTRNLRNIALFEVLYHRGLRATEVGLLQMTDLQLGKQTPFCP